jgi:hypothetical protein
MIPTLKKKSACDSIPRLFLVFWLRQLNISDDLRSSRSAHSSYEPIWKLWPIVILCSFSQDCTS